MTDTAPVSLVVDVANVMGSRPDGWWRDRAGAATGWLAELDPLAGRSVTLPGGPEVTLREVIAVLEGKARAARDPQPAAIRVVRAERDGDTAIVQVAERVTAEGGQPVVVTADRGLRQRLPAGSVAVGPGWLREVLPGAR